MVFRLVGDCNYAQRQFTKKAATIASEFIAELSMETMVYMSGCRSSQRNRLPLFEVRTAVEATVAVDKHNPKCSYVVKIGVVVLFVLC